MPPRRPGGKYKGLVGRSKTDQEMAAEAIARAKKQQEAALAKAMKRMNQDVGVDSNSKENEEEMRKQKILGMLMGGRKGGLKKIFKAWQVGTAMAKKERRVMDRKGAWMASCEHVKSAADPHGKFCTSCDRLTDTTFLLPFDVMLRERREGSKRAQSTWGALQGAFQTGIALAKTASRSRASLRDDPFARRKSRLNQTQPEEEDGPDAEAQPADKAFAEAFADEESQADSDAARGTDRWLGDIIEPVQHYRNGRKMYLDPELMRISSVPPERPPSKTVPAPPGSPSKTVRWDGELLD
eukprot:CAMPEP_0197660004 /NCGR_PEP_ID=MMETSP1338-20131121/50029_1 /TAXON_ID=43686 ORGANISM="Pelagodinium beii, Strain RCC1491" /NCGR_SAMPLE_ID=MMETSP1338 /ASSEMBLY_ACC=CAM_ASM_000754 /LENGTH=296 /DNA_ID=CAMNT_0043237223 /DNA_START=68 /DNA_END=958 /DNA_ORIENTATION=+